MEKTNHLKNINIDGDTATVSINPEIYPIDVVQKAAYIMMNKATIIIGGDPKTEIKIELKKLLQDSTTEDIVREFNEELLNYAVYKDQTEKNRIIREIILQRILLSNDPAYAKTVQNIKENIEQTDPEKIFKKWEDTEKKESQ